MGNCLRAPDPLGDSIERNAEVDMSPLKSSKLPIVFVIGGPGSGKGEPYPVGRGPGGDTIFARGIRFPQCEMIAREFGYLHVSSGELLRAEVDKGSKRGNAIGRIMQLGKLVPMDVVLELVKEKMLGAVGSFNGFLIDGCPREKEQGKLFESLISPPDLVMYYVVTDQVLRDRLLGRAVTSGRVDDNEETIRKRIKKFHKYDEAVVRHYRKKLVFINGERDVDSVFKDSRQAIQDLVKKCRDK